MTITLDLPESVEHQLQEEASRSGFSLSRYILHRLQNYRPAEAARRSLEEVELLEKINLTLGFAPEFWGKYYQLAEKLEDETMNETENQEMILMVEKVEAANVERLQNLFALAKLRGVSIEKLMADLGIYPRPYEIETA